MRKSFRAQHIARILRMRCTWASNDTPPPVSYDWLLPRPGRVGSREKQFSVFLRHLTACSAKPGALASFASSGNLLWRIPASLHLFRILECVLHGLAGFRGAPVHQAPAIVIQLEAHT